MREKSYADALRASLAALPVKKKCCMHAVQDARHLYETELSSEERAARIGDYPRCARCEACVPHFIRTLFLHFGSITDPEKRNHLEFSVDTQEEADALAALLLSENMDMKQTVRKKKFILYCKSGEQIADFLALIGANTAAFDFMNSRIEREFRSNVNRQVNCDTANIEKALQASEKQIAIIRKMVETGVINALPESLRITAELRLQNEQLSLKELGDAHDPPITKSGVSHRLQKILAAARAAGIES